MQWIEVSVPTRSDEIDDVCAQLAELGAGGMVVEDETDFQQFLEQNHQYWDYVDDALEAVGMSQYVKHAPHLLSGGQKQRIAIARTLLKDNNILIFDDSLSAVDTETDAQIRAALRHEQKDVTTLIISHRVTTLSQADLILVLENGQITQQGTHAELCSQPGLYQRINSIQNALEEELTQAKAAEGVN